MEYNLENPGIVETIDICPTFIMNYINEIPFPNEIKNLLEVPFVTNKIIKRIVKCFKTRPFKPSSVSDEPKYPFFCCFLNEKKIGIGQGGAGIDLNENKAIMKAYGECIERFCLRNVPKNLINGKDYDLLNRNPLKFDVRSKIEDFKENQISWVPGKCLTNNKDVLIPAQLVYVPDEDSFVDNEPLIRGPISTGAAFGDQKNGIDAIYRGILECIERDSAMIAYLTKYKALRVELDTPLTKEIEKDFERYNLKIHVFDITLDLGVPSFLAIVTDESGLGPAQAAGTHAGLNPEKAVIGAILEAYGFRLGLRLYHLSNKGLTKDENKIIDLLTRGLYWYKKSMRKNLDFLLKNKEIKSLSKMKDKDKGTFKENVKFVLKILKDKGINVYTVDISTEDMKKQGLYTIKSIIPKLHPLYLVEDYKIWEGERIEKFGGIKNKVPHPYP